jgi:hypothetical protein
MSMSKTVMRIKANAQVFGVDLTAVDEDILFKIIGAAMADEWAIVEDLIQGAK